MSIAFNEFLRKSPTVDKKFTDTLRLLDERLERTLCKLQVKTLAQQYMQFRIAFYLSLGIKADLTDCTNYIAYDNYYFERFNIKHMSDIRLNKQ
jgi:hypothetical protein